MMDTPKPEDLRPLIVRRKDKPMGLSARLTFALFRLGAWLGIDVAKRAYTDFVQVIDGVIYYMDAFPSRSLRAHESVHDWQQRTVRWYRLRYLLSRKARKHFEAMAYAYEVVHYGRDAEERAGVASDPVYFLGWTRAEARALIDQYVERMR